MTPADILDRMAQQDALLEALTHQLTLNRMAIVELERARLQQGAVPLVELLDAWSRASGATHRARAQSTAAILRLRGYGDLPGASASVIERRMRRRRRSGQ